MTNPSPDPLAPFEPGIRDFLLRHDLLTQDASPPLFREWAVAVSGGGDSVFLCHLLKRLAPPSVALFFLHFNHHTDKKKNGEDLSFVRELSERIGACFHSGESPSPELSRPGISETILRQERHVFFEDFLRTHPRSALFLGHQLDDRIETILANLFRGGGPRSLIGIAPSSSGRIFRPLLAFGRQEIRKALDLSGLSYREDPANTDPAHLRNRIRLILRGEIDRFFPPNGTRHLAHLGTLMERETSPPDLFPSLLCENETPGRIRFSFFMYRSMRPSTQGLFIRTLLNRQRLHGLPIPTERNLLRSLEQADPEKPFRSFPLGKEWALSLVFGRADLVYQYPETETWRYDLSPSILRESSAPLRIPLPRGGVLFLDREPIGEETGQRRSIPGQRTSFCVPSSTDQVSPPLFLRYWESGLRVFSGEEVLSPPTVSSFWKDRPMTSSVKALLPVLCRGPLALWIPGILDRTDLLPQTGAGSKVTLTYQSRERSEWKKFLENP